MILSMNLYKLNRPSTSTTPPNLPQTQEGWQELEVSTNSKCSRTWIKATSNNRCWLCSKIWITWELRWLKMEVFKINSRWLWCSRCSKWWWWCRVWCFREILKDRLNNSNSSNSNNKRRLTHRTICFLICSSQLPTQMQEDWSRTVPNPPLAITHLINISHMIPISTMPRGMEEIWILTLSITSSQGQEPNNQCREAILRTRWIQAQTTLLICLIDSV